MADSKVVPRRRVRVLLRLADGTVVDGEAYVAIRGAEGRPELLVDRLNDASERYFPIAVADRHFLVRKSSVVVASTRDETDVAHLRRLAATRRLHVEIRLVTGAPVAGSLPAGGNPGHDRALDHLNALGPDFVTLLDDEGLSIVNVRQVVGVTERAPRVPG